jgi:hypothetical protein
MILWGTRFRVKKSSDSPQITCTVKSFHHFFVRSISFKFIILNCECVSMALPMPRARTIFLFVYLAYDGITVRVYVSG